jgi:hypothetical protein
MDNLKAISELLLNALKGVAIIVAAIWAFYKFNLMVFPNYAATLTLTSKPKLYNTDNPSVCKLTIDVSISDDYQTAVTIQGLHIHLWLFDFLPPSEPVSFFDFSQLEEQKPAWELSSSAAKPFLITLYPHQQVSYQYFLFLTNSKQHNFYYKITVDSDNPKITTGLWDTKTSPLTCGAG